MNGNENSPSGFANESLFMVVTLDQSGNGAEITSTNDQNNAEIPFTAVQDYLDDTTLVRILSNLVVFCEKNISICLLI